MVKASLLILLLTLALNATEHFFNYSDITAPGEITEFPANFGSFRKSISFSGALNALSRQSYRPNINEFQTDAAPAQIEPRVLSSGLGQSWGGWGFVIKNDVEKIKLLSETLESTAESRAIEVHLGAGLKLDPNWNIGWGISINNDQEIKTEILTNTASTDMPIQFHNNEFETFSTRAGFGYLYETESVILGMHLQTPKVKLRQQGTIKSRAWSVSQNQVIKSDTKQDLELISNWDLDLGVKFGTSGFTYSISDTYHFAGTHEVKGGFEFVGSWGRISTGLSRHQKSNQSEVSWSLGFCRSEKGFDWGVGPFYKILKDTLVDRDEVGILYSSQINY